MFESRLARLLMRLGAVIGLGAVVIVALETQINFPDWLIRLAMIKLAFIGSFGLLAAGALLGRHAKARSLAANDRAVLSEPMTEFTPEDHKHAAPADGRVDESR